MIASSPPRSRVNSAAKVTRLEPVSGGVVLRISSGAAADAAVLGGSAATPVDSRWDGAVIALPAEDAVPVIAQPELATRLRVFHRAPAAIVYLGYPASAVPEGRDGFGFLVALGEDIRVLGVVFESVVWPERAPADHVLLRCIFGGGRDPEAATLDDATLIAHATRDVGMVLGARGTPVHASVARSTRGVAQYPVGHRDLVRAAVTAARPTGSCSPARTTAAPASTIWWPMPM